MIHESKDNNNNLSKQLTRRSFFKNIAFLSLVTFTTTRLEAKGSKKQFKYQETPKNGEACKDCIHFLPDKNKCKVVEGSISPEAWCTLYNNPPK